MKTPNPDHLPIQPVVLIIDDDKLFRRSIARMLEGEGYSAVPYDSLAQFVDAKHVPPLGCAILDLNLPDANGLEIQEWLATNMPSLAVIFLTGFARVPSSVRAMKAGAIDFLEKPVESKLLLDAVRRAIDQSALMYRDRVELADLKLRYQRLSKREREVFALITSGLLNKQAAAELRVAEKTVKVHRAQVMSKMEAESFAELVKIAQRLGISQLSDSAPERATAPINAAMH